MPYQPAKYKKPGRINVVSVGLIFAVGLALYLGDAFYPHAVLRANVNEIMRGELVNAYNLHLKNQLKSRQLAEFQYRVEDALIEEGVDDPDFTLEIGADEKTVWMQARFASVVTFRGLRKTMELNHETRVETDAERVDWD